MSMIQLIQASAHATGLPAQSVHMIATSPPYWGLRAYAGEQRIDWPAVEYAPMPGLPGLSIPAMTCGLGEETTPEAYIGHMMLVMREMWRVLAVDGEISIIDTRHIIEWIVSDTVRVLQVDRESVEVAQPKINSSDSRRSNSLVRILKVWNEPFDNVGKVCLKKPGVSYSVIFPGHQKGEEWY